MPQESEDSKIKKEVTEFGNGGHVILPNSWVGESVTVNLQTDTDGEITIQPPISEEKILNVLRSTTKSDYNYTQNKERQSMVKGTYQLKADLRLSIEVELAYEGDGYWITEMESGRVVHMLTEATSEEIVDVVDWWNPSEIDRENPQPDPTLLSIDPDVEDIIDLPQTGYGDMYRYTVKWNGSPITSTMYTSRVGIRGIFYIPPMSDFTSLDDYKSSIDHALATAISGAPEEDYNKYFEVLTKRGVGWGSEENDPTKKKDLTREEILNETTICKP